MKIDRIPLAVRLERVQNFSASDPKYDICTIRNWSGMPICDYLAAFPEGCKELQVLLSLTEEELQSLTYQEAAVRVSALFLSPEPEQRYLAAEAIRLLALPFYQFMKGVNPFVCKNNE